MGYPAGKIGCCQFFYFIKQQEFEKHKLELLLVILIYVFLGGNNMSKVTWKPGTFLYPLPAVMVPCGTMEESNIITVAWTGIMNTDAEMV